jgi:hypothetical protein
MNKMSKEIKHNSVFSFFYTIYYKIMGSIRKNKSIKKSRKKYLKRNKTKGKTREYRRTKNKRQRNKKSKNKRLTKRNKRYSQQSRKKFIRKKKIYQEGGVDKYFGTLTPEQVDILTYDENIRRYIGRWADPSWEKEKICRITGYGGHHDLPKMLMIDRQAKEIGMMKLAPLAEHITYRVKGSEKPKRMRAEYKPVSELCYWMIKVAEKGASEERFSLRFEPSSVNERSICKLENYDSVNIDSADTLVEIFHNLLNLIQNCLKWYRTDYNPDLDSGTQLRNRLLESLDPTQALDIFNASIGPYLSKRIRGPTAGISEKGEVHIDSIEILKKLFNEKHIPHTLARWSYDPSQKPEIVNYMELCVKLGFFDVTAEDDTTMLEFMIDRVPELNEILNNTFFEGLLEEVQVNRVMKQTGLTEAEEAEAETDEAETDEAAAAQVGWLSALPSWGNKAAEPGAIELTEMNAMNAMNAI